MFWELRELGDVPANIAHFQRVFAMRALHRHEEVDHALAGCLAGCRLGFGSRL